MALTDLSFSIGDLTVDYGDLCVVDRFSIDVKMGEVVTIMGPSGSGKSSLLRCIAGLLQPTKGGVMISGGASFLGFQQFDAFPWWSVHHNVAILLKVRGRPESEVEAILTSVGLEGHGSLFPRELSGGMLKRLAFARCLASNAKAIALDEPFSSLDVSARVEMQELLMQVVSSTNAGLVLVTHDIEEAAFVSNRILLCDGPPLRVVNQLHVESQLPRDSSYILSEMFHRTTKQVRQWFQ